MTPDRMLRWLLSFPFPGAVAAMQGGDLVITLEGELLRFDGAWRAPDGQRIPCTLDDAPSADDIHAEIRRGLAIARGITGASWHRVTPDPSPTWEQTKECCVGPDLPGAEQTADDPLYDRTAAAQALAKVTDERDALIVAESTLSKIAAALAIPALEPHDDALSMVRRLVDAHAVVSQRLIGSQKEVAEVSEERDRLKKQAAVMRVNYAEFERRGQALDEATARADKVEDRLRRDDELRSQIAVAVGLDGSASLALIFDVVARDRPTREISRLSGLLDVFAAPVTFGERRLSTVERAEWALRRALRERDECAPRMAQLIDAEVCLDVLGVPAYAAVPGDEPGDASEALTVAERIRLHFGAQS